MKKILFFIFILSFFFTKSENIINGNVENGKDLFKKNCTACHSIDLKKKMVGPALEGITEKRSREWLHKWIKNNKSLRESGDKEAIFIYQEYGGVEMNSFLQLSEKQIDDILSFIKNPPKKENSNTSINNVLFFKEENEKEFLKKLFIFFFSIILIILIWILYRIYVLYKLLNFKNKKNPFFEKKDFLIKFLYYKILVKNRKNWYLLSSIIGLFIISNIYLIWSLLMNIDVNKGYQPIQPIYFSHKIHSDINKIDCLYCHSDAKYGKIAGIPSMNVCMNCHITINEYQGKYIEEGKNRKEYNNEIKKIYYATGWDEKNQKYLHSSHPVKWIKIHNLPDFVHFDHSLHILSGNKSIKKFKKVNLVCNACHGEIQKMDQVQMVENLTMEWCISCHKNINIDLDNQYYKKYFNQNQIKNKQEITLDMVGGTECSKCHY